MKDIKLGIFLLFVLLNTCTIFAGTPDFSVDPTISTPDAKYLKPSSFAILVGASDSEDYTYKIGWNPSVVTYGISQHFTLTFGSLLVPDFTDPLNPFVTFTVTGNGKLRVNIRNNLIAEHAIPFTLTAINPVIDSSLVEYTLSPNQITATIISNPSTISYTQNPSILEHDISNKLSFTITSTLKIAFPVVFTTSSFGGTATKGTDYTIENSYTADFTTLTSYNLIVTLLPDTILEPDETVSFDISVSSMTTEEQSLISIPVPKLQGTIQNDNSIVFTIADVTAALEATLASDCKFPVTVASGLVTTDSISEDISITVDIVNSSTEPEDFDPTTPFESPLTLKVADPFSSTTLLIIVNVEDDNIYEIAETFSAKITKVEFASQSTVSAQSFTYTDTASTTINNDDLVTVTITAPAQQNSYEADVDIDVTFAITVGTKVSDSDITFSVALGPGITAPATVSDDVIFPDDSSSFLVTIPANSNAPIDLKVRYKGETKMEQDETFTLTTSGLKYGSTTEPVGITVTTSLEGTIYNDDIAVVSFDSASVTISVSELTAPSSATRTQDIKILISKPVDIDVPVTLSVGGGSATSPDDYTGAATSITITPTNSNAGFYIYTFNIVQDPDLELDEDIVFTITGATYRSTPILGSSNLVSTVTLANDDKLTISPFIATTLEFNEGNTGDCTTGNTLSFKLQLNEPAPEELTIDVTVRTDILSPAASADDYAFTPNSKVTVAAGADESSEFIVNLCPDVIVEPNEFFSVEYSTISCTTTAYLDDIAFSSGNPTLDVDGQITNDDSTGTVFIVPSTPINDEGTGSDSNKVTFTVQISGTPLQDLVVTFKTSIETGDTSETTDFTPVTEPITFKAGVAVDGSQQTVDVFFTPDNIYELDETFTVSLTVVSYGGSTTSNAYTVSGTSQQGIIKNDDAVKVAISTDKTSLVEGNDFTITLTLDAPSEVNLQVNVKLTGVAQETSDYTITTKTIDIAAGSNPSASFFIYTEDDDVIEGSVPETLVVTIESYVNPNLKLQIGTPNHVDLEITDNDSATVSFAAASYSTTETDNPINVILPARIQLGASKVMGFDQTFTISLTGVEATANTDFDATLITVTILKDQSGVDFTFTIFGDDILERTETFTAKINDPGVTGITTDPNPVTVSIGNDDGVTISIADPITVSEALTSKTIVITITGAFQGALSLTATDAPDLTVPVVERAGSGGDDYTFTDTNPSFTDSGPYTISFTINTDDMLEENEKFLITITAPKLDGSDCTTCTITTPTSHITIDNNDSVTLSFTPLAFQATEVDASATNTMSFVVHSSAKSSKAIDFIVNAADLTTAEAEAGIDYVGGDVSGSIVAGNQDATVLITINGDNLVEKPERFEVTITSASWTGSLSGLVLISTTDQTAVGTIQDQDSTTVKITSTPTNEDIPSHLITFTVTLDPNPASQDVTFTYTTNDGTAKTSDNDYVSDTDSVTITPADTSVTFTVTINADSKLEEDEIFTLILSGLNANGLTGVSLPVTNPTGTIKNDDSITIIMSSQTAQEGDANFKYSISFTGETQDNVIVTVSTADGTAIDGTDYVAVTNAAVTLLAGTGSATDLPITIKDNNVFQPNRMFDLNIVSVKYNLQTNPSTIILPDPATGKITIADNDPITVTIAPDVANPSFVSESTPTYLFNIKLSNPSASTIVISVKSLDITDDNTLTATRGISADYTFTDTTVTFDPNDDTKQVSVSINNDNVMEPAETFKMEISMTAVVGISITTPSVIGTISVDPADQVKVSFTSVPNSDELNSASSAFNFDVTLSNPSSVAITFTYKTQDGTATTADNDYASITPGTITFAANTATLTQTIPVNVNGDLLLEDAETFKLVLENLNSSGLGAVFFSGASTETATATIKNDDLPLIIFVAGLTAAEGNAGGTTNFAFHVTLSQTVTTKQITFDAAIVPGTATSADYNPLIITAYTIDIGSGSADVIVEVLDDGLVEIDETFQIQLSNPKWGGVSNSISLDSSGQATATITNDDKASISVSVLSTALTVTEGDTTGAVLSFVVTSDKKASKDMTVNFYTISGGTATAGSDYTEIISSSPIVVTIPADSLTPSIQPTVTIIGDLIQEKDETVNIKIDTPLFNGAADPTRTIVPTATATDTGTIADDDTTTVYVANQNYQETDATHTVQFPISLTKKSDRAISVVVTFAPGTTHPVESGDYTLSTVNPTTVTIPADSFFVNYNIDIIGDQTTEFDETLQITISTPLFQPGDIVPTNEPGTDVVLGTTQAIITIANDDSDSVSITSVIASSNTEGDVGTGKTLTFHLSTTNINEEDISLTVALDFTGANTASSGDILTFDNPAIILAGVGSADISVEINGDILVEADTETFTVVISDLLLGGESTNDFTISNPTAIGTIQDDDSLKVTLSASATSGTEGTSITFTATLSSSASQDVVIPFTTSGGTATSSDYSPTSGSVTVLASQTTGTFSIALTDDSNYEVSEDFTVTLGTPLFPTQVNSRVTLSSTFSSSITITDNDPLSFTISGPANVNEASTAVYTISLSTNVQDPVSVTVSTSDGTGAHDAKGGAAAGGGNDYQTNSVSDLTFNHNDTPKTFSVIIYGDSTLEYPESFTVSLSAPTTGTTLGSPSSITTVINNDDSLQVTIGNAPSIAEGNTVGSTTTFTFPISIPIATDYDVTVIATTSDGTATAPSDYTAKTNLVDTTVTIAAGDTTVDFTVEVNQDLLVEAFETFSVTLSDPKWDGNTVADFTASSTPASTTINNDDSTQISIAPKTVTSITEGTALSGRTAFTFTLSLAPNQASEDIIVFVSTTGTGSATATADYDPLNGFQVTIAKGTSSSDFILNIVPDDIFEGDETVQVKIDSFTTDDSIKNSVSISSTSTSTITITDDDTITVLIDDIALDEGNTGGATPFTFQITLSNPSSQIVGFKASTSPGTALSFEDFTPRSNIDISIPIGSKSATFTVDVVGDLLLESHETFSVTLSDLTWGVSSAPSQISFFNNDPVAVATIQNDDSLSVSVDDISLDEGTIVGGGNTIFTFTIHFDHRITKDVELYIDTMDGTALAGSDYTAIVNTKYKVLKDNTEYTIPVLVNADTTLELDQVFTIKLSQLTWGGSTNVNATIVDSSGIATIKNDDSITVSITAVSPVTEGTSTGTDTTTANFAVSIDSGYAAEVAITVRAATNTGTALSPDDFASQSNVLVTIDPLSTSTTFSVEVVKDDIMEATETFSVTISSILYGTSSYSFLSIGTATSSMDITDDDQVKVSFTSVPNSDELNSASSAFNFDVTLSNPSSVAITFTYKTQDGTATTADNDYASITPGTITFAANTATLTQTIPVNVNGDLLLEDAETFKLVLENLNSSGLGAVFFSGASTETATATIQNDDSLTIEINSVTLAEGDGSGTTPFTFTVKLSQITTKAVTFNVDAQIVSGSTSVDDFAPLSGGYTITANSIDVSVTVNVNKDSLVELDETFSVVISNIVWGTLQGGPSTVFTIATGLGTGTGTITNDDKASISVSVLSTALTVTEGDTTGAVLSFVVTSDKKASKDMTVNFYTISGGTATAGSDYTEIISSSPIVVTIPADSLTPSIQPTVTIIGDLIQEKDETVNIKIDTPLFNGAADPTRTIVPTATATDTATGTIADDDTTTVYVANQNYQETDTTYTVQFPISLTKKSDRAISVVVTFAPGTTHPVESGDYTLSTVNPTTVTIPADSFFVNYNIDIIGDQTTEFDETLQITISTPLFQPGDIVPTNEPGTDVVLGTTQAIITIANDDSDSVSITSVIASSNTEGDVGTGKTLTFHLSTTNTNEEDISLTVALDFTGANTASSGDIFSFDNPAIILAGVGSADISVNINGDILVEADTETFTVVISDLLLGGESTNDFTISNPTAIGTIQDDDSLKVTLSASATSGTEGTSITFTATLSSSASQDVVIPFTTSGGTATSSDYSPTSGSVTVLASQTTGTFSIALTDDSNYEVSEDFTVTLGTPLFPTQVNSRVTLSSTFSSSITIIDNDPLSFTISGPANVNEASTAVYTISLSTNVQDPVSVTVSTSDGTGAHDAKGGAAAGGGNDYQTNSVSDLTFNHNDTPKTFSVIIYGDSTLEYPESFTVSLSAPTTGTTLGSPSSITTVINNDDSLQVTIGNAPSIAEGNTVGSTTTFTFPISIPIATDYDVTVIATTSDGTATAPSDYTAKTNLVDTTVTIAAGDTTVDFTVEVNQDLLVEAFETFSVTLSDPKWDGNTVADFTASSTPASTTINNDDSTQISIAPKTVTSITEGTALSGRTAFTFTLSLAPNQASEDIIVFVSTTGTGSATATADYDPLNGFQVTIAKGTSSSDFILNIVPDDIFEGDETVQVKIDSFTTDDSIKNSVSISSTSTSTITITDDDTISIQIDDVTLNEGNTGGFTAFNFPIKLSNPSGKTITISATTTDGTALALVSPSDYNALSGSLITINPGETDTTVTVNVKADLLLEQDESFTITLSGVTWGGPAAPSQISFKDNDPVATGNINNDDTLTAAIDATVSLNEGTGGAVPTVFTFFITFSQPTTEIVSFVVDTNDGTAVAGSDYFDIISSTINIPVNSLQYPINVLVFPDSNLELDQDFTVVLTQAKWKDTLNYPGFTVTLATGTGTIKNDDSAKISIAANLSPISEGTGAGSTSADFTISLDHTSEIAITVEASTGDGTAVQPADYTQRSNIQVSIPANTPTAIFTVSIVKDNLMEPTENFVVTLGNPLLNTNPSGLLTIDQGSATQQITDDDQVKVSFTSVPNSDELNSASSAFNFDVTLSNPSSVAITFTYKTQDGTATTADNDYASITTGTITFAANTATLTQTIPVNVNGDLLLEDDETFKLVLENLNSSGLGAVFFSGASTETATATIQNDDSLTIEINSVTLAEGNGGATTPFTFTVKLSQITTKAVTFHAQTQYVPSSADSSDFVALASTSFDIAVNQDTQTVTINVNADSLVESTETFSVLISQPQWGGVSLAEFTVAAGLGTGTGTITNDDKALISINPQTPGSFTEGSGGGPNPFQFVVTTTTAADRDMIVTFATTTSGSANPAKDFTPKTTSVTFVALSTTAQIVTVNVEQDDIIESDETIVVQISGPEFGSGVTDLTRVDIATSSATITITDDDIGIITVDDVSLPEGNTLTTDFTFKISTSKASDKSISFVAQTDPASATTPLDFVSNSELLSIPGDETTLFATFVVKVNGDTTLEANEIFLVIADTLQLNGGTSTKVQFPSNAANTDGTGTIINDDSNNISINDVTLYEGSGGGTTKITFTVSLMNPTDRDVTTKLTLNYGTATASDLNNPLLIQTVTILTNTPSTTVDFFINADDQVEIDESFTLTLSDVAWGGALNVITTAKGTGTGTISNDDYAGVNFNPTTYTVGESGGSVSLTVTLNTTVEYSVTILVSTNSGSATSPSDYTALTSFPVTFAPLATTQQFSVSIGGDGILEPQEQFTVTIDSVSTAGPFTVGPSDTATVTINDDDPVVVTIADVSRVEGNAPNTLTFTVQLSNLASAAIAFTAGTTDGSAISTTTDADFTAISTGSPYSIAANQPSTTITVPIAGDFYLEGDESFTITLTGLTFGGSASSQVTFTAGATSTTATATLTNDDTLTASIIGTATEFDLPELSSPPATTAFGFTINLSHKTLYTVILNVDTANVDTDSNDLTPFSSTVTINAGSQSGTVSIPVKQDTTLEPDETFNVVIFNPIWNTVQTNKFTVATSTATGTIRNDDSVELSVTAASPTGVTEGTGSALTDLPFTILLTDASSLPITVYVSTTGGSATSTTDYQALSNFPVTIPAGDTSATVNVKVVQDNVLEDAETVVVQLNNPLWGSASSASVTLAPTPTATGTINDDDNISINIAGYSHNEGNAGTTTFTFVVTLSNPSSKAVSMIANTNDGSATLSDSDYVSHTGPVVFLVSETTHSVSVTVNGDTIIEADETFTLVLDTLRWGGVTPPNGEVTFTSDTATGTIKNDDTTLISIDSVSKAEGSSSSYATTDFDFTVSLSNPSDFPISVTVTLTDGTTDSSDYAVLATTSVTFSPARSTAETFTVQVVKDLILEKTETFTLTLSSPTLSGSASALVNIGTATGTGTIINDDSVSITIQDYTALEGSPTGTSDFTFVIELDQPADHPIYLGVRTTQSTAHPPEDYVFISDTITIDPFDTSYNFVVKVQQDTIMEDNEVFFVVLSNPQFDGVTSPFLSIGDNSATGTINNDDSVLITISDLTKSEGTNVFNAIFQFTVSLNNIGSQTIKVDAATSDNSAISTTTSATYGDYVAKSSTLQFTAGSQSQSFDVFVVQDSSVEPNEDFKVTLSNPLFNNVANAGVTIGSPNPATGTITNDDSALITITGPGVQAEDNTPFVYSLTLSNPVQGTVSLSVTTTGISATDNVDFTDINAQPISFAPYVQSASISVAVTPDNIVEIDETFNVVFSNLQLNGGSTGLVTFAASNPSVTILATIDNDDSAVLTISDQTVLEGAASTTTPMVFTISTNAVLGSALSFSASTADGTATLANNDYVQASNSPLSIAASASSTTFTVTVNGDGVFEDNEYFYVDLSSFSSPILSFITISDTRAVGTITNDDQLILTGEIYSTQGLATLVVGPTEGVLANDVVCCGTLTVLTPPKGTLNLAPDGSFTYNSASFCYGIDSFVYQYTANGQTTTAKATITVNNCGTTPLDSFIYKPTVFAWTLPSTYNNEAIQLKIYNSLGGITKTFNLASKSTSYIWTCSGVSAGVYTAQVSFTSTTLGVITFAPSPATLKINTNTSYYTAYKCCVLPSA